jgi:hypothetical protein
MRVQKMNAWKNVNNLNSSRETMEDPMNLRQANVATLKKKQREDDALKLGG